MASVVKSPDELNDMQQQLMVAAMENRGRLEIRLRSDSGRAVRGKDKVAFFDAEDSDVAGQFIDALRDTSNESRCFDKKVVAGNASLPISAGSWDESCVNGLRVYIFSSMNRFSYMLLLVANSSLVKIDSV